MDITFSFYVSLIKEDLDLKISKSFIEKLKFVGFTIINKLGEGSFNLILKCMNINNNYYALIINKNQRCDSKLAFNSNYSHIINLIKNDELNTDYIIKPFDSIIIENCKLSDDINYCNMDIDIPIEIQECAEQILSYKILSMLNDNIENKVNFLILIRNRLLKMLEYLYEKSLFYNDLHRNNLALMTKDDINTMVFIDLESITIVTSKYSYEDGVSVHLEIFMDSLINDNYYDEVKDYYDINWPISIFKNEEEKEKGVKLYEELISE